MEQKVAGCDSGLSILSEFGTQKIGVSQGHVEVEPTTLIKLAARLSRAHEQNNRLIWFFFCGSSKQIKCLAGVRECAPALLPLYTQ